MPGGFLFNSATGGPIYPVTCVMHFLVAHFQQALACRCAKASPYSRNEKERKKKNPSCACFLVCTYLRCLLCMWNRMSRCHCGIRKMCRSPPKPGVNGTIQCYRWLHALDTKVLVPCKYECNHPSLCPEQLIGWQTDVHWLFVIAASLCEPSCTVEQLVYGAAGK